MIFDPRMPRTFCQKAHLTCIFTFFTFLTTCFSQENSPLDVEKLNQSLGLPVWSDDNLWDDTDTEVASRLDWPLESRTKDQASFRLYPRDSASILGSRPYSLTLYSEEGKPVMLSMIFINKGDYKEVYRLEKEIERAQAKKDRDREKTLQKQYDEAVASFPKDLETEAATMEKRLMDLLGPGSNDRFGEGKNLREKVTRWDWHGHALLLSVQEGEYLAIRIVSTESADNGGKVSRKSDSEIKGILESRVLRRDNGDVVVTEIPMVNQGPKGFCVPATWERYLRYMGIPSDMYILAMAGNTSFGGGTRTAELASNVEDLVRRYRRRLDRESPSLDPRNLSKNIDSGLPLMWTMFVDRQLDSAVSARSRERESVQDWTAWTEKLKPLRKAAKDIETDPREGHVCMIIGYNEKTEELAISDSWGPGFEERWLTVEEAEAISQKELRIIRW